MEVKKITEGMTAPQVAQVIDDNFKAQNKILEDDIKKQNNAIGVSEYKIFSESESVAVGDVRLYDGVLYECVEATTGAFDAAKWKATSFKKETEAKLTELGSQSESKTASLELMLGIGKGYIEGYYIGSGNVWEVIDSSFFIISVNPSDEITIRGREILQYTFLKDNIGKLHQGGIVPFCDGYSRISTSGTVNITAPSDAKYLYILRGFDNINYSPYEITINGLSWKAVERHDKTINDITPKINERLNIFFPNVFTGNVLFSLEDALSAVPVEKRKGGSLMFFRFGESSKYGFYYMYSTNVENWENISYWKKIYVSDEVDSLIAYLEAKIAANVTNINTYDNILESLAKSLSKDYYASYNTTSVRSRTIITNNFILRDIGDSAEVRFRINGGEDYTAWINLLGKVSDTSDSTIRFGFYTKSRFWLRGEDNAYVKWESVPNVGNEWHTLKIEVVEDGWELFIDEISCGVQVKTGDLPINAIATPGNIFHTITNELQRYDVAYVIFNCGGTTYELGNPAFIKGSTNVLLSRNESNIDFKPLYAKKESGILTTFKRLQNDYYIAYPLEKRYVSYTTGQYPSFLDNWGIGVPYLATFDGVKMTKVADLFRSGEAELAVNLPRGDGQSGDIYVGGAAHGFENIFDGDNGREILFLIDNTKYFEDSEFDLKEVCRIEVVQHTLLYQSYSNTNPWADVFKRWNLTSESNLSITTEVIPTREVQIAQAQFAMMCVFRRWLGISSNNYLTSRAIKNNNPFVEYVVEDGWDKISTYPQNASLKTKDTNCTKITEYGERGLGFSLEVKDTTIKNDGGMFVGTNSSTYNKIYFDLTGSYTTKVGESLKATQEWCIIGGNM